MTTGSIASSGNISYTWITLHYLEMEIQDFLEKYQNGEGCKIQFKSGKIISTLFVNVARWKPLLIANQGALPIYRV